MDGSSGHGEGPVGVEGSEKTTQVDAHMTQNESSICIEN